MRAILNPTFITKSWLALFYLFDFNPTIREEIGATIQSRRTKYSMAVAVVGFMICSVCYYIANWYIVWCCSGLCSWFTSETLDLSNYTTRRHLVTCEEKTTMSMYLLG